MAVVKNRKVSGDSVAGGAGAVNAGVGVSLSGTYSVGDTVTAAYPANVVGTIQFTRTMRVSPFTKTLINGAVANAVNSLSYKVQLTDVGQIIGVDSSNQMTSTAGGLVPTTAAAKVQQAAKLRPNEAYNGGGSGLRTAYMKFEFPADFTQVQHLVGSKVSSGTPGTYKVQFAVTDTIAIDTVNNAYLPTRAGVTYNDKSANGWKDATFGGAASKQIGLAPNQSNNSVIHMSTDVMDLASIPRADGKPGGILLVKVTQMDPAGNYTAGNSASNIWDTARDVKPWFTEWYSKSVSFDAIADLTKLPTGAPYNADYAFPGFPIVTNTSALPTDVLLFTGDSRKCAAYMPFQFAAPARVAAGTLSTPTHPITVVNAAGSGHNQSQFQAIALDMISAGLRPTVIHVPGFSQNGFSNFANYKASLDSFMAAARAFPGMANVKFVIDTDYWVGGYAVGTSAENGRRQCVAYAKSLDNGTTVFCFDSDAIISDYSNPSAMGFKSAYFTSPNFIGGDGVHAGAVGLDAMTYGDGVTPGLIDVYKKAFQIA